MPGSVSYRASTVTFATRILARFELVAAGLVTLPIVFLHVFFGQQVGALWRDEVNSVNVASLSSFRQVWDHLPYDSFPILYFGVLRMWMRAFGAENDVMLRVLGVLIGLGIVGVLWLNARQFGARAPLFSLALLGYNPIFVRYGDSNRAYGLGILLILLTTAAVWRVLASTRPRRLLLAMFVAVLSVHAIYYNSVLLFAICVAGASAAAVERRWKTAVCILSIGVPAALSLLVYTGTIQRVHQLNDIIQYPVTLPWLWRKLSEVTGSPDPLGVWIWTVLIVGALALTGWAVLRLPRRSGHRVVSGEEAEGVNVHGPTRRVAVFAGTALVVATLGYTLFLVVLGYPTEPWYYIGYLAFAAVCLDAVFGRVLAASAPVHGRFAIIGCAVLLAALAFPGAQKSLFARQTNLDLQAAQLERLAGAEDLIVCMHWESAITLAHYYHGKATLLTLLPMDDHQVHRYDLVRTQMMRFDPVAPTLARMEATLRAEHRVWVSGGLQVPGNGRAPVVPPPMQITKGRGADSQVYYRAYSEEAGYLLQKHATELFAVPVEGAQPVLYYENNPLTGFQGWH